VPSRLEARQAVAAAAAQGRHAQADRLRDLELRLAGLPHFGRDANLVVGESNVVGHGSPRESVTLRHPLDRCCHVGDIALWATTTGPAAPECRLAIQAETYGTDVAGIYETNLAVCGGPHVSRLDARAHETAVSLALADSIDDPGMALLRPEPEK
jgi:hypothetical protein